MRQQSYATGCHANIMRKTCIEKTSIALGGLPRCGAVEYPWIRSVAHTLRHMIVHLASWVNYLAGSGIESYELLYVNHVE